jgi:hypothetical protein
MDPWTPALIDAFRGIYKLIESWQTLITGFIAIYAAHLALRGVREQISQARGCLENRLGPSEGA